MKLAGRWARRPVHVGQLNVDAFIAQAERVCHDRRGPRYRLQGAGSAWPHSPDEHRARRELAGQRVASGTTTPSSAASTCIAAPRPVSTRWKDDLAAAGRHYAAGARDVASQVADVKGSTGWEKRSAGPEVLIASGRAGASCIPIDWPLLALVPAAILAVFYHVYRNGLGHVATALLWAAYTAPAYGMHRRWLWPRRVQYSRRGIPLLLFMTSMAGTITARAVPISISTP